jgi:hypothetical protein
MMIFLARLLNYERVWLVDVRLCTFVYCPPYLTPRMSLKVTSTVFDREADLNLPWPKRGCLFFCSIRCVSICALLQNQTWGQKMIPECIQLHPLVI